MKKLILILLFFITVGVANAQTNDTTKIVSKDTTKKWMPVEVQPSFPGGLEKLFMYFAKNEKDTGDTGRVRVSFTIEKDGSISDIKIEQSLSESADKESIRLVSQMPKWNPGMQGGRPVRVRYSIPIKFSMK